MGVTGLAVPGLLIEIESRQSCPDAVIEPGEARLAVLHHFVGRGGAPAAAELAESLGCEQAEIRTAFRQLAEQRILVLEPGSGELLMAMPFSARPTPYEVRAGGRTWWANCAWDALGIAAMLDTEVEVSTRCPDCSEPIELRAGAASEWPEHAVIHFALPPARWWDDIAFT